MVFNAATIPAGMGVSRQFAGSSATNQSTGSILGVAYGVYENWDTPGVLVNEGAISATVAVVLHDGGFVSNASALASISGGQYGVKVYGGQYGVNDHSLPGTVFNAGSIAGVSYDGLFLESAEHRDECQLRDDRGRA